MTDGTTPTVMEEDMIKVREVFQKALDAIIAATELSKTVQAMRVEVDALRKDIADTQARNVELDRMLADTRRQRDDAEQALAQVRSEVQTITKQYEDEVNLAEIYRRDNDSLKANIGQSNKDRDDAHLEALALREALDSANARLAGIFDKMGVPFTPYAAAPTNPQPESEPIMALPEPAPTQPEPTKVYDGDPNFDWSKPAKFDSTVGLYYNEA